MSKKVDIKWEEIILSCTSHGWLCTSCPLAKWTSLEEADDRTKAGYLRGRYNLSEPAIKKLTGLDTKKVIPQYTVGSIYSPWKIYKNPKIIKELGEET